jgi:hypothetical protein
MPLPTKMALLLLAAAAVFGFPWAFAAQMDSSETIQAGEALFRGKTRFANGGPSCAACHTANNVPFPGGGTLGPDLTHEYSKVGAVGLQGALQTLYFPTMTPLFGNRPLTTQEQSRLFGFLKDADRKPTRDDPTAAFSLVSVVGCAALLVATWIAGRKRIRSVRRALLDRAMQKRGMVS